MYLAVKCSSACKFSLKYYENQHSEGQVHSLLLGTPAHAQLSSPTELVYFHLHIAEDELEFDGQKVRAVLSPLKGRFSMVVSTSGDFPTAENFEQRCDDHFCEIALQKAKSELVIGVQLISSEKLEAGDFARFSLTVQTVKQEIELRSGMIVRSRLDGNPNNYYIEVQRSWESLLVFKGIQDGYTLSLCAKIANSTHTESDMDSCDFQADEKKNGIYLGREELREQCKSEPPSQFACVIKLRISSPYKIEFSLGFVHDDEAFHLFANQLVLMPAPLAPGRRINFVYHIDAG